jgi:hypothetical protein
VLGKSGMGRVLLDLLDKIFSKGWPEVKGEGSGSLS